MKPIKAAVPFVVGVIFTLVVFSQLSFRRPAEKAHHWFAPAIPSSLSFAGEQAPLDRWDIREKFDREYLLNYYNAGSIVYLLKLSNRYFPIISERLQANGVPDDFKYLCIAESNMQGWAVSKSGAVGFWQFMDGTAPGYGLETSGEVDQRQDLQRSTDAACKYLKQAYAKFGSWTAAAASYNCGTGGYERQAAFQRTKNYYDLQLPEETNKYIFRILAFKHLIENAEALGFRVEESEKYKALPVREIKISKTIPDLALFAIEQGTSYKMLRNLNPWLKGRSLTVKTGKSYTIKLPAGERIPD